MSMEPVYNPFTVRPTTAIYKSPAIALQNVIRDQFHFTTWLLIGGLIQGLAHVFLPYRNIVLVLPLILFFTYKLANTALILLGVLPNPNMADVIPYRTAPVFPSSSGLQEKAGAQTICAILVGVVSHHPLGMLGPGFKETGDRFNVFVKEFSANASAYGFLGASSWLNATERTGSNEYAAILYFENEDYLHKFAHSEFHNETLRWWRDNEKNMKHIGIMHEVFACPKNGWEGMYINYHPTGLGSASKEVTDVDGRKTWVNPLVKAKGKLAYSKGRMGRAFGDKEWEAHTAYLNATEEV
ncbi:hypothetical protein IQ06DRAFT_358038 [Phaeosphaeriaceae sp. SRC1lsM3a]|nr:hypothetical protein IQ06DRAFT_358038 [Stagonospora sp. SRC1lsM3a]